MTLISKVLFVALVLVFSLSSVPPVMAAEETLPTVRVALLDMSSLMGPGMMGPGWRSRMAPGGGWVMGPGYGTGMGPGTMGPGVSPPGYGPGMGPQGYGPGMGPGMMGPGWGWGGGPMPGWAAQHMMGPGGAMMGMMSIRTSTATARAGKVRFEVANYSTNLLHEMEVVAVEDINGALPYDYNAGKVTIEKAREKGEVEDLKPNDMKVLELTLSAGNYLLVCNLPGHYAAGMVAPFTVTP